MQDSGNNDELDPINTSADEQTVPELPGLATDGTSRRNFLKAAVVASAAVAAAGGAAGVALVSGKTPHLSQVAFNNCTPQCSGADPCSACLTNSSPQGQLTGINVHASGGSVGKAFNPGDFYFWITDTTAPAGYYQVSLSITGNGFTANPPTTDSTTSKPFALNGSNGVFANSFTLPSAPTACPDKGTGADFGGNSSGSASNFNDFSSLQGANSYHYTGTGGLQFAFHLTYTGGVLTTSPTTITFTFTLSYSATGTAGTFTTIPTGCNNDTFSITATAS